MAEAVTLIGNLTPNVTAATDLRTAQFKAVSIFPNGVRLADQTNSAAAAALILANKPNSGQACELVSLANVGRVIVASTNNIGDWLAPVGATGLVGVASWNTAGGPPAGMGIAMTAAATGSGQLVSLWMRR